MAELCSTVVMASSCLSTLHLRIFAHPSASQTVLVLDHSSVQESRCLIPKVFWISPKWRRDKHRSSSLVRQHVGQPHPRLPFLSNQDRGGLLSANFPQDTVIQMNIGMCCLLLLPREMRPAGNSGMYTCWTPPSEEHVGYLCARLSDSVGPSGGFVRETGFTSPFLSWTLVLILLLLHLELLEASQQRR